MSDELNYLNRIEKNNPVLLDIGANIGDFTFYFLSKFPNGKSICFEPNTTIYTKLMNRFKNDRRVNIYNFGLSDHDGVGEKFYFVKTSIGMSSLHFRPLYFNASNTEETKVDLVKLDNIYINLPRIDYVKIDTEGHELRVLQGAASFLLDYKPKYIQFEAGGCYLDSGIKLTEVISFLNLYGYTIYNENNIEITYDIAKDNYNYKNYLAVKC